MGDLKLPEGVEATLDKEEGVVNVSEAREEEPEEEVVEPDMDSIEVEQKGKGDLPDGKAGDSAEEGKSSEESKKEDLPAGKAGKKEE